MPKFDSKVTLTECEVVEAIAVWLESKFDCPDFIIDRSDIIDWTGIGPEVTVVIKGYDNES